MIVVRGGVLSIVIGGLVACAPDTDEPPAGTPTTAESASAPSVRFAFTDVTASSGLAFTPTSGAVPSQKILEVKGGGIAMLDVDGDGDLDVFVPNGATLDAPDDGPGARLYRNDGGLRFTDITAASQLDARRWTIGAAAADYDQDGDVDLYLTCYGGNQLWRNDGTGRFEDVTASAGVGDPRWSAAAAFGDIDGDGDLDLYVANYVVFDAANPPPDSTFRGAPVLAGPIGLDAHADALYENQGDGTFRDVTDASGCGASVPSYGLGVVMLDFTGDGRMDIFVGNDSMANFLFVNQGEGQFVDNAPKSGIAASGKGSRQATMGIAIGDVKDNGWPDVFTTNFASDTNTLHVNEGGRFFDDETTRFGLGMVSFNSLGWACGFHDFDHDGSEDLLIFNGHVYPTATKQSMGSSYRQRPLLFAGTGDRFDLVPAAGHAWLEAEHCDRGAAFGDLDGDGDVDVVVNELNGPVRVLRNDVDDGAWLRVAVSDGLGCRVEVTAGERLHRRWLYSGGSFVSVSDPVAHFGLGEVRGPVEVAVTWPDGTVVSRQEAINTLVRVGRGDP